MHLPCQSTATHEDYLQPITQYNVINYQKLRRVGSQRDDVAKRNTRGILATAKYYTGDFDRIERVARKIQIVEEIPKVYPGERHNFWDFSSSSTMTEEETEKVIPAAETGKMVDQRPD